MHCLAPADLSDLKRFAEEDIEHDAWSLDHVVLLSMREYADYNIALDSPFAWRVVIQQSRLEVPSKMWTHAVRMGFDGDGSVHYADLVLPEPIYRVLFPDKHYIPNPPGLPHRILQMVAYLRRRACSGNDSG